MFNKQFIYFVNFKHLIKKYFRLYMRYEKQKTIR